MFAGSLASAGTDLGWFRVAEASGLRPGHCAPVGEIADASFHSPRHRFGRRCALASCERHCVQWTNRRHGNLATIAAGSVTISGTTGPNRKQLHILDSNLNPIPGLQDTDTASRALSLTTTLAPGTYYAATSLSNLATNLAAPATSGSRTGALLDFPGIMISGQT
jgi:hypothetical protein